MKSLIALAIIATLWSGCSESNNELKLNSRYMKVPAVTAPDWGDSADWVNSEKTYTLAQLRGKLVLLDFWTFGCINCQQILPDLHRLEQKYGDYLVVIGVHSAKFKAERADFRIKSAADKLGITHPIINDSEFKIWDSFAVKAWPTLVLIDHRGKVIWQRAGEGFYKDLDMVLGEWISHYNAELNAEQPIGLGVSDHAYFLKFPTGLVVDGDEDLWIADAGNHRILKVSTEGVIKTIVGKGSPGLTDGTYQTAQFNDPQGLFLIRDTLLVADTRNHAIRGISIKNNKVFTLVGDGKQGKIPSNTPIHTEVFPASPWAIHCLQNECYVANAGNHRILKINDVSQPKLTTWWGTGREALVGGNMEIASFNQPSALAIWKKYLLIADAEASAIRAIDLESNTLKTLVGRGLFVFGYRDGKPSEALLQHPQGLAVWEDILYIADTYNGCIRTMILPDGDVETLIKGLKAPVAVAATEKHLYITDTDAHSLLKANRLSGAYQQIVIAEKSINVP